MFPYLENIRKPVSSICVICEKKLNIAHLSPTYICIVTESRDEDTKAMAWPETHQLLGFSSKSGRSCCNLRAPRWGIREFRSEKESLIPYTNKCLRITEDVNSKRGRFQLPKPTQTVQECIYFFIISVPCTVKNHY